MKTAAILAALAVALAAPPALAWAEMDGGPDQCAVYHSFRGEGGPMLVVGQTRAQLADGNKVAVALTDTRWTVPPPGRAVAGPLTFDGGEGRLLRAAGPVAIEKGLGFAVTHAEFHAFALTYPGAVRVLRGEELVAQLDLTGLTRAWALLNVCRERKFGVK